MEGLREGTSAGNGEGVPGAVRRLAGFGGPRTEPIRSPRLAAAIVDDNYGRRPTELKVFLVYQIPQD
nr:MAG TPA: hypothetical protein [Caudoviricetes sp.]